ncbi:NIPSNAP family protein [Kribbella sp. NPDC051770]|uniref:NIPSNAP family protein n=1 Tax=Kribbella sp. NPDC051770 TaxID=3155413 RepID=UPI00341A807A
MDSCAVLDLRQYTLFPGRRDELIELFDREFVEGQEAYGMHLCGQFRDLDDPDRFVWLRGFTSYAARAEALEGFYSGPVWKQHAAAANATMKDSDDALLLRPVMLGEDWPTLDTPRLPLDTPPVVEPASVVAGAVYHRRSLDDGFLDYFRSEVVPHLPPLAGVFETLPAANNFPALPLRDETVLVWFARFADDTAYRKYVENRPALDGRRTQHLRLRPTARSQFR